MKLNTKERAKAAIPHTHGGGEALRITPEQELQRSVMSCMLWEGEFYEDGKSIADRIVSLVGKVSPETAFEVAVKARNESKLRHVPLLIARTMAKLDTHKHLVADLLYEVIQRPDELTEFLAIYWKDKRQPLSAQVKKGLARALCKFDEYQLAKYDREGAVKLRDVLFLSHARPENDEQKELFRKLVDGELKTPDTWEVALSSGGDKKEHWERLLESGKLGAFALIRNLRNMVQAKVNKSLVRTALKKANVGRILPFRFIAAAKHAPEFEPEIEDCLLRGLEQRPKLKGKTVLIVDVSGSMYGGRVSKNSEMSRAEVACSLAILIRELCEESAIYATDARRVHKTELVPARRGFALSDAIYKMCHPLGGGGIFLKQVMDFVYEKETEADRVIVITDEQDCSGMAGDAAALSNAFGTHNYLINVASYKNGIGYRKWVHIDGWSDSVVDYIQQYETIQ